MHVVIDTLAVGWAGTKDDIIGLIKYLAKLDNKNQYTILVDTQRKQEFFVLADNIKFVSFKFPTRSIIHRLLWQQFYLPILIKQKRADLVYELSSFDIFFAHCPVIINIANIAPFNTRVVKAENGFKKLRLILLNIIGRISGKTANYIITLSETAKKALIKWGLPADKITAILQSADVKNLTGGRINFNLPEKYILAVSHIDRYKNYSELIAGYQKIKNAPILLIAGGIRDKKYYQELLKIADKNRVKFLGFVSRDALGELYQKCRFFIFPSLVETCPRTLVEALKFGLPILCSNASVMPEIGQDAVLYFDPNDPNNIGEKIKLFLKSPKLKNKLRKKALARGKNFSWIKTTKETLKLFESCYQQNPPKQHNPI